MPASTKREDRTRLDGFEREIFKLVREHATSEQWRAWLRAPLEHAAAVGNMDLFTRLMDAGADGSAGWRGCHGRTLLGAAACGNSEEMVLALLKAGAKDDVTVRFGAKKESALHVAAAHGSEKVYDALMLAGADPRMLDGDKQTPLHIAAQYGHDGVVNTLLLIGADPNARTGSVNQTPLHLASAWGYALCVSNLLVGGAEKDSLDRYGRTPLHLAARHDRLGAVDELLAAGTSLDIRGGRFGWSSECALDIAAQWGHVDVVRALLRHGSSVNASDKYGYTALHYAANVGGRYCNNGEVVRVLLEAGADIERKTTDYDGSSPLHLAVSRRVGSSGTIRALLEAGANVNARRKRESTPLHDACYHACVAAVETLLRWGADEKLENAYEETPDEYLREWEDYDSEDSDEEYEQDVCDEQREADEQRIRHMLARAPADRIWRRRGWLVLARSFPAKVQLAHDSSGGGGSGRGNSSDAGGESKKMTGGQTGTNVQHLVGRVVGMDVENVFRLVVGFL